MEKVQLKAKKRTLLGRKAKKLREQGILPANIYGKGIKSEAVEVDLKEFQKIYHQVGETGLVNLEVSDEKANRPILIHNLQLHPVSDSLLHVDFYQVSLKDKIKAMVPVISIGQSPAVVNKEGLLLTLLNEIEVECLPTDLPEKIGVDISKLAKVNDEIKVADLSVNKEKVAVLSDLKLVVCKIGSLITEEQKKELEAEAAAKAAAAAEKAAAAAPGQPAGQPAASTAKPTPAGQPVAKTETAKPAPGSDKK